MVELSSLNSLASGYVSFHLQQLRSTGKGKAMPEMWWFLFEELMEKWIGHQRSVAGQ